MEIQSVKMRVGMSMNSRRRTRQMIPLGERVSDVLEWRGGETVDLMETSVANDPLERGTQVGVYWEISDPNLSEHKEAWVLNKENGKSDHTLGEINKNAKEPANESSEKSKFKYIQRSYNNGRWRNYTLNSGDEYWSKSRTSSKGFWSFIHTGMKGYGTSPLEGEWQTIDLGPSARDDKTSPPDWLLLNLLGATYPMQHQQWTNDKTLPDEFSTVSFMNSTFGQVNPNTRIYPKNDYFDVDDRTKPLEGVFKHLRPDNEVRSFVDNIIRYQNDEQVFEYIGEIAEVPGYSGRAKTNFDEETFLRNMAGCLTTNSNTFGMWGAAQTVRKSRANRAYNEFETGDQVVGEKRFFAVIERYVWPGKDGVPGNAHVDKNGIWDRISKARQDITTDDRTTDRLFQLPGSPPLRRAGNNSTRLAIDKQGTYAEYDGPQPVGMDENTARMLGNTTWRRSPLEEAYNPPQPIVKYRVVYFKYLDE